MCLFALFAFFTGCRSFVLSLSLFLFNDPHLSLAQVFKPLPALSFTGFFRYLPGLLYPAIGTSMI